jgi:hypothetical protein
LPRDGYNPSLFFSRKEGSMLDRGTRLASSVLLGVAAVAFAGLVLHSEVDAVTLELASSDSADRLFSDWTS